MRNDFLLKHKCLDKPNSAILQRRTQRKQPTLVCMLNGDAHGLDGSMFFPGAHNEVRVARAVTKALNLKRQDEYSGLIARSSAVACASPGKASSAEAT